MKKLFELLIELLKKILDPNQHPRLRQVQAQHQCQKIVNLI